MLIEPRNPEGGKKLCGVCAFFCKFRLVDVMDVRVWDGMGQYGRVWEWFGGRAYTKGSSAFFSFPAC